LIVHRLLEELTRKDEDNFLEDKASRSSYNFDQEDTAFPVDYAKATRPAKNVDLGDIAIKQKAHSVSNGTGTYLLDNEGRC